VGTKIEETHHLKVYSAVRQVPNGECCMVTKIEETFMSVKTRGKKPWVKFVDSREKTLTQIYSAVT